MKKLCWVPDPINDSGINELNKNSLTVLSENPFDNPAFQPDVVAAIFRGGQFSRTMMEQLPNLRVIAVHGVGIDRIDLDAATERHIVVLNTPGMNSRSVAEHALGLLFDLAKRITLSDQAIRDNQYNEFKNRGGFLEILGQTLGIIGFGATGQHLAQMAHGLGMRVLIHSSQPAAAIEGKGYRKASTLEDVLQNSDFVSLHAPSTPETWHLMNASRLGQMKPSAFLINTSRGALVDEHALVAALKSGALKGAGLDVFEQEPLPPDSLLLSAPNVILTPHSAASTDRAMFNMALAAAEGVVRVLNGEKPLSLVNPDVYVTR